MWKAILLSLGTTFVALSSHGCITSDTANPGSDTLTQSQRLQPCIRSLSMPEVYSLEFAEVLTFPSNDQPEDILPDTYFVAYSTEDMADPRRFDRNIPAFTTIFLEQDQCHVLSLAESQAVARKLVEARYPIEINELNMSHESALADSFVYADREHSLLRDSAAQPYYRPFDDVWAATVLGIDLSGKDISLW